MKHVVIPFLLFFLLLQNLAAKDGVVSNVRFEQEGESIKIHYDLQGEAEKIYKVAVSLSTANNADYHYKPQATAGDIGKVTPGAAKTIAWAFKKEFPQGLKTEDLIFTVTAEIPKNNMLYYLVGGGAAILGVVAIIATQNNDEATNGTGSLAFDVPGDM